MKTEGEIRWKRQARFKSKPEAAAKIVFAAQRGNPDQMCQAIAIVDAARPIKSPIHDDFEWDDAVAAELHRREVARSMIRHLVLVVEEGVSEPLFCHIRVGDVGGYMPTRLALLRDDTRAALLNEARRDARAFREKYQRLRELSAVVQAIDDLLDTT